MKQLIIKRIIKSYEGIYLIGKHEKQFKTMLNALREMFNADLITTKEYNELLEINVDCYLHAESQYQDYKELKEKVELITNSSTT